MYADRVENNNNATSSADMAPCGLRAMSNKNGPSHGISPCFHLCILNEVKIIKVNEGPIASASFSWEQ